MDTLTFNSPILLRHLTFSEAKKMPISQIDLAKALEGLGMTMSQVCVSSFSFSRFFLSFFDHFYLACHRAVFLFLFPCCYCFEGFFRFLKLLPLLGFCFALCLSKLYFSALANFRTQLSLFLGQLRRPCPHKSVRDVFFFGGYAGELNSR